MAQLAAFLLRTMEERQWTRRMAAERTGISQGQISNIVNNPDVIPELETLKKLAQGFQVPLRKLIELCGYILEGAEPPPFIGLTDAQRQAIEQMSPEELDAILALARARRSALPRSTDRAEPDPQ